MKRLFLASVFCIAFSLPAFAAQQSRPGENITTRAVNPQAATDCNLCFTCGGDWPIQAGYAGFLSGTNNVQERGGACSGALTVRTDNQPRLCCKD